MIPLQKAESLVEYVKKKKKSSGLQDFQPAPIWLILFETEKSTICN